MFLLTFKLNRRVLETLRLLDCFLIWEAVLGVFITLKRNPFALQLCSMCCVNNQTASSSYASWIIPAPPGSRSLRLIGLTVHCRSLALGLLASLTSLPITCGYFSLWNSVSLELSVHWASLASKICYRNRWSVAVYLCSTWSWAMSMLLLVLVLAVWVLVLVLVLEIWILVLVLEFWVLVYLCSVLRPEYCTCTCSLEGSCTCSTRTWVLVLVLVLKIWILVLVLVLVLETWVLVLVLQSWVLVQYSYSYLRPGYLYLYLSTCTCNLRPGY